MLDLGVGSGLVAEAGVDPSTPGTYAEHLAALAEAGDRPALLQDQLAWMRTAGLHAACLHLYGNRAVIVGRRPARAQAPSSTADGVGRRV